MRAVALPAGVRPARTEDLGLAVPEVVLHGDVGHRSVCEMRLPERQHGVVLGVPPVSEAMLLDGEKEASRLVRRHRESEMAVRVAPFGADNDSEMNAEAAGQARKKRKNLPLVEGERRQVRARQGQHRDTDPSGLLVGLLV
mgnify:CR=1 FL=1